MPLKSPLFFVETYGCSASHSDSEIMSGLLLGAGLLPTDNILNADLIIINTCFVKQTTENKILSRLREISEKFPEKKLIICGCIPEAAPERIRRAAPKASLLSTNRVSEIEKAVRKAFEGKRVEFLGRTGAEKADLPKLRKNKVTDIIQICSGCLGNCSYCGTKLAKGGLISYLPESIANEVMLAKLSGAKEFLLTGQDISCYGFDIGKSLPELLEKILEVKGNYFVRLGMMNPVHLTKIIKPLLYVCEDERVYKFFHIPVQSGSDNTLKSMNRKYISSEFEQQANLIREKFPFCAIGTDIIVGYPTETEEDFMQTIGLLERVRPDWINISRYTSRPKTAAAKLKPIDSAIVKERSERAAAVAQKIAEEQTKKWVGWSGKVLVVGKGIGKNFGHRSINISPECPDIGKFAKVEIVKAEGVKLFGKVI